MKKLLLSFLLCSSFISFAQDWNPFPLGQKSYFLHHNIYYESGYFNLLDTVLNEFCVDSIRDYGSSQTMYFNFTTPNIGDCYSTIINNPSYIFYQSFHDNERPDSITVINNEYTFYFYDHYFNPQNTFLFKPITQKDSSWIFTYSGSGFNQLKITCDSIYYDNFYGTISDSLKLFSVQALNNGTPVSDAINQDKYILSRNHGFKSFKNFPLLGIKTNTIQEGFSAPVFEDYFHLNIGDVLIWEEHFEPYYFPPTPPSHTKYFKDSLVNVYYSSDTISYHFFRTWDNLTTTNAYTNRYRSVDEVVFSVSTSTLAPNALMPTTWGVDLDEVSPYILKDGVVSKNRLNGFKFIDLNPQNNCQPQALWDYSWWEFYNTKYGIYEHGNFNYDQSTNWKIIGSTINGISEGANWMMLITDIKENTINNPSVSIYPNPSNSGNFTLECERAKWLEIMSIDGKTVFTQTINQPKTEIKTGLPKGLYFVKVTFKNKKQVIQKLIITQ